MSLYRIFVESYLDIDSCYYHWDSSTVLLLLLSSEDNSSVFPPPSAAAAAAVKAGFLPPHQSNLGASLVIQELPSSGQTYDPSEKSPASTRPS